MGLWRRRVLVPCALVALVMATAAAVAARVGVTAIGDLLAAPDAAGARAALVPPLVTALAVAAALVVAATAALVLPARAALALVACLVVGDLAWAHHALNPTAPASFFGYVPEVVRSGAVRPGARVYAWDYSAAGPRGLRRRPLMGAFVDVRPGWPPTVARALGLQAYLHAPTAARWRLGGSFDQDLLGLAPRPVMDLRAALSAAEDTPTHLALLRLAGVDAVIALHDYEPPFAPPRAFRDTPLKRPVLLYHVPDPRPATYAVARAMVAEGDEGLRRLFMGEVDPSKTVVLAAEGATAAEGEGSEGAPTPRVEVLEDRPDRLRARVEAETAGWLVHLGAYDPGWRATVDGGAVAVRRANHAFLAVGFPPGTHVVELAYRPSTAAWGLGITVIGLLSGVVLAVRSR